MRDRRDKFNGYLVEEAARDNEARTYIYKKVNGKTVAFFSIACYMISENSNTVMEHYAPAILIDKFAVDIDYQHLDYFGDGCCTLAQVLLSDAVTYITDIAKEIVGAKYILLFSTSRARRFYEQCGFENMQEYVTPQNPENEGCIPMFMRI